MMMNPKNFIFILMFLLINNLSIGQGFNKSGQIDVYSLPENR